MINLSNYITEKLHLNKNIKVQEYNYQPKDKEELISLIEKLLKERGEDADLNDIDVSNITDMGELFHHFPEFNGDISKWNVSNVTNMESMFWKSQFNDDISKWDVSNVKNMRLMFYASEFNQDISSWNVNNVEDIEYMFYHSPLENNPPKWYHE